MTPRKRPRVASDAAFINMIRVVIGLDLMPSTEPSVCPDALEVLERIAAASQRRRRKARVTA
jgi:hypothetical protein